MPVDGAGRALDISPPPRPYDLIHSYGVRALAGTDLRATQLLLGHSTPAVTERYARAAVDPHLAAAVARLERAEQKGRRKPAKPKRRPKARRR